MQSAHLDFETRSTTELLDSGVYRYVEDPNTAAWCFSYRIGDGLVNRWKPGSPEPEDLLDHIAFGGTVVAHNAAFERWIWNIVMRRMFPHWPVLQIEQQDCTMARAAAISHPQALGTLSRVLQLPAQKDMTGNALMKKMAKPRRINADGTITWWDEPGNEERLGAYCDQDVFTECDVDTRIPPLTAYEKRVWQLDQIINDRGIPMDTVAIPKCVAMVDLAKKSADSEMRRLTGRAVAKCTADNAIIEWVQKQGIDCTTVRKDTHDDLIFMAQLAGKDYVADVIKLRSDAKKTSTAKYAAMMDCMCWDGRIRGTLNYWGAGPGRWAGRLIQPQNFPRVDHEEEGHIFSWLSELLDSPMNAREIFDMLVAVHGESGNTSPLRILSRFLRSTIKAPPGKKFIGGDFSNIEGRVNAWFADEMWKLEAFRKQDAGTGPDNYKVTAALLTGKRIEEVSKFERQSLGKTTELACGYQGSVGALLTMSANYNVSPFDIAKIIVANTKPQDWDEVAVQYAEARNKEGLQEREWTALKIAINGWREKNPKIVQSWWDLQDAAIEAVASPGIAVKVLNGRVTYYSDTRFLWCILPSGRMICYAQPAVETTVETLISKTTGEPYERIKRTVHFWGFKEGQWKKLALYGGLQCENIVQGTARCIMVDRMFDIEAANYPIILTVHDELLSEVDAHRIDLNEKDYQRIMSIVPEFTPGLPLTAKAWEDTRYVK